MRALSFQEVQRAAKGQWLVRPQASGSITSVVVDSREARPGSLFVALAGQHADGHGFVADALDRGAGGALVARPVDGVPREAALIRVQDTLTALGELARYYRSLLAATVVAITGSNGKTTTKEMVAHLLRSDASLVKAPKSFNNFVGVPLTIFSIEPATNVAVIELGTSAPGEIHRLASIAQPHIGVITNIGPTHLEGLGSVASVAQAKAELLGVLGSGGTAVLNWDDDWCRRIASQVAGKLVTFGLTREADVFATQVVREAGGYWFLLNGVREVALPVVGAHNLSNALAAAAVCRRLGLTQADIAERFVGFRLPAMRLEETKVGEVTLINDAYNANPVSMSAALREFAQREAAGRRLFVAGDMKELGPESPDFHRELGLRVAAHNLDGLFAVGEFAGEVAAGAAAGGFPEEAVQTFATVEALTEALLADLEPGDVVLLKGSRAMGLERVVEAVRGTLVSRKAG